MKKQKGIKNIYNYIYLILLLIFSLAFINKYCQNDLFFDIKTGESIIKNGVDFIDHFCFIKGLTYMYHHFLYDIIIYYINNWFGFLGVFIFFYIIVFLLGLTIFKVNTKIIKNKKISLLISIITLFCLNFALTNRVQTITYLLFFLEFYLLNRLYDSGEKKYSILVIALGILVVNLHMPLWFLTIVFFLPFIAEDVFKYISLKFNKINKYFSDKIIFQRTKKPKNFYITFLLMLFSGLVSPLKLYPYTFFIKVLNNPAFSKISEMKANTLIDTKNVLILLLIFIITLTLFKKKTSIRNFAFAMGLFIFSLMARRNVAFFLLIIPTILSSIVFKDLKIRIPIKIQNITKRINAKILACFSIFILIFAYGIFICTIDIKNFDYNVNRDFPIESVTYIKENLDYKNIKLYNEFNVGSFLEFHSIPVFIDSRAEVYIKEFNGGTDIWYDYFATSDFDRYKEIMNKYNFDYALVDKYTSLYYYLNNDDDYEIIYEERNEYVLFEHIEYKSL